MTVHSTHDTIHDMKTKLDTWIPGKLKASGVRHNYVGDSTQSRCGKATRPTDIEPATVKDTDAGNCQRCQLLKIRKEVAS